MKKLSLLLLACAVTALLSSSVVFAAPETAAAPAEGVAAAAEEAGEDAAAAAEDAGEDIAAAAAESNGEEAAEGESAEGESAEGESAEGQSAGGPGAGGPPDFNSPEFNPGIGEKLNVIGSVVLLPLCFLSIILWFFRAFGAATEKKNNGWLKIYKGLRKIHIPVGAATIIIGLYHTIFASINHGFSVNWGSAAMVFYLLGFVCWLLRKPLKRRWVVLHRFTTLIATICMIVHCAPYLKLVLTVVFPAILRKL